MKTGYAALNLAAGMGETDHFTDAEDFCTAQRGPLHHPYPITTASTGACVLHGTGLVTCAGI